MKLEVNFLDQIKLLHMYCSFCGPVWGFHRLGMNQYAATEMISKVCNTKKMWFFQEDWNHPTDFSNKTNTLHVHLFSRIFYKGK